jgi:hypothetical protein
LSIECDESYTKSYLRRGKIREELEDFQAAIFDYKRVQEIDPSSLNYLHFQFNRLKYEGNYSSMSGQSQISQEKRLL